MLQVANAGFVDAIGIGFLISAALLMVPRVAAVLYLPGRACSPAVTEEIRPVEAAGDEAALAA